MIKNKFLKLTLCLALVLTLAFPAGATAMASSGSNDDTVYVSLLYSGGYYKLYVRNAVELQTLDLGIYINDTYQIDTFYGFMYRYEKDTQLDTLYRPATPFNAVALTQIGEFITDGVPKLGYVAATAFGGAGVGSVRINAVIEAGGLSITDFIPVANIVTVPEEAKFGVPLVLDGTVIPMFSTNRNIVWTVKNPGETNATIVDGKLFAETVGLVTVTATIANGKAAGVPYTQDFDILVKFTPVTQLAQITNEVEVAGQPLEIHDGGVIPTDATYQEITWSLKDPGKTGATLINDILYTQHPGTAVLTATIKNGLAIGVDYIEDVEVRVKGFTPVTDITGIPTTLMAGAYALDGTVVPDYATEDEITWSIADPGTTGANITGGNILNTTGAGTATVRATVIGGLSDAPVTDYKKDFPISITVPVALSGIAVTTPPSKSSYFVGEALDLAGMAVTATYTDNSTKAVTNYTAEPATGTVFDTPGTKTITVKYEEGGVEKTATTSVTVNPIELASIAVATPPTKTEYFVGENLDTAGMTLTATYNDGSSKPVVAGFTTAPAGGTALNTAGNQTITVNYTDGGITKSTTTTVLVKPVELDSIAVTANPTKSTYIQGENLATAGMVVTATYNDGTSKPVTGFTTNPANGAALNTVGNQSVTVSYAEGGITKTTAFSVLVNEKPAVLESIAVTAPPTKTSYFVGDQLDLSGMVVTATYDNTTTNVVAATPTPTEGTVLNTAGNQTISLSYTDGGVTKTTSTSVTVVAVALESIAVTAPPTKTEYFVGDPIETQGLVLTATNNNGSTATVTTGFTIDPTSFSTAGTHAVTVSYGGKTATFNVTVVAVVPVSIAVTTQPAKKNYVEGEALDLSGMVVTATYNNGTSGAVTGYTTAPASGAALNTIGEQTVVVSYPGVATNVEFTVTVSAKPFVLTGIEVTSAPAKAEQFVGGKLDLAGMVVTATYDNGDTIKTASVSGYQTAPVEGADLTAPGPLAINVTYTESGVTKTATTSVTVKAVELESIEVTAPPNKTVYFAGDFLALNGLAVTAVYNNGHTEAITDGYATDPEDGAALTLGTTYVTVTYGGKAAYADITVNPVLLTGIEIASLPAKTEYYLGETLDLEGLAVTASYNNGSTASATGCDISPMAMTATGTQTITVSYTEGDITKTASFDVNVSIKPVLLTGITVTSPPAKTAYYVGDAFDSTGMVVTATYDDASSNAVTDFTTDADLSEAGDDITVTVSYTEGSITKETTLSITVNPVLLDSIAVTTPPAKTEYYVGDALDLGGLAVTATYNNGSSKAAIGFTTDPAAEAALNTVGSQIITVSYTEDGVTKTATTTVTVNAIELDSIAIASLPAKTEYYLGDTLELEGLIVTASYNNGSSKTANGCTASPMIITAIGTQTITVSYTEGEITKTDTFEVTVDIRPVLLTGIAITSPPEKTVYYVGDDFDSTGMVVTATYDDDSSNEVTGYTVDVNLSEVGDNKTVTVSYTEGSVTKTITATFTVNVNPVLLESISVAPEKTEYYVGDTLDLTNLVVTALYNSGKAEVITSGYTTNPESGTMLNTATEEPETVTVSYTEGGITKETTFTITVTPVKLVSISIKPPDKTDFFEGFKLNLTGLKVKAIYNNGNEENVPATSYKTDPEDGDVLGTVGTQTITVSFTKDGITQTETFTVEVKEFIPVDDITGLPTATGTFVPLLLSGTVVPSDASKKVIDWKVEDEAGTNAKIDGSYFTANKTGTARLSATIKDGYGEGDDYVKDDITIYVYPWSPPSPPSGTSRPTNITNPGTPLIDVPGENEFSDIRPGDWFSSDVDYVHKKGLMNGTSATQFSPNTTLTRGMVVTVLYRNEGSPDGGYQNPFNDVVEGTWYTEAVKWAAENGIVMGYGSGNFGPNDFVTREQLAAIFRRYASYKSIDIAELREYEAFNDEGKISEFAIEAVKALFKASVINGKPDNLFDPQGTATRAEYAAMLHRFLER